MDRAAPASPVRPRPTPGQPTGRLANAWSALRGKPTTYRTGPADHAPDHRYADVDWSGPASRSTDLAKWTGRVRQPKRSGADRLRLVPPTAALATAAVMQTIAVTDTVGGALADGLRTSPVGWLAGNFWIGYLGGLALGVAVASCFEGGAAYLMDLYDKHLLARDSVWMLRLAMVVYVAGSALAIHWWAAHRHLPTITSWLLAGMSASALFLWSRGSRWRHREAMRIAGQLDPAMPRLSMAAKLLHPVRWLVTLYLVSWEPAATTEEARARYEAWRSDRSARRAAKRSAGRQPTTDASDHPTTGPDRSDPTTPAEPTAAPVPDHPTTRPVAPAVRPRSGRTTGKGKPTGRSDLRLVHGPTAITDAAMIRATYGENAPARNELHRVHGGNAERWTKALRAYRDGADQHTDETDDPAVIGA